MVWACLLVAAIAPCAARAATIIRLRADHIVFYYDRYLIEADGNVHVETSDGARITGDAFSMDLKLNRFLIASNVHFKSAAGSLDGAAISDFLDFNRIYFVPVISKPDRWTYENGDFTHPLRGREMPGDVFYFPDLHDAKKSLSAGSAVIGAHAFVRFEHVQSYLAGVPIPMPSFYVYFGVDQDLAANSLSGANYDATWNVTGNSNAISAVHLRYDSANKGYLSFEQHFAGSHEYAVVSDNPATKQQHFWNLVGGDRIGKRFELYTFDQLETTQKWFRQPLSASFAGYIQGTQAFPQSFLTASAQLVNYNLVNNPYYNHPSQLQLTATTFNHRIGKSPFYESIDYGIGFNHDAVGISQNGLMMYGGVEYTTLWNHVLGYTLYVPSVKFGDRDNPYRTYFFNATLQAQRQWTAGIHHVNTTNTTFSVSRTFSREFNASATYNVANTADVYNVGGYVPYAPIGPDGKPVLSFLAFKGASTLRTASIATTYSATPDLVLNLSYQHHDDFPLAVPDLYPQPPLNNIGQPLYANYLGQPPNALIGEVRARLLPHLVIDVQRTYFFNYGTIKWSPQFVVQFSQ